MKKKKCTCTCPLKLIQSYNKGLIAVYSKNGTRVRLCRETDNKEGGSAAVRTDQQQTVFGYTEGGGERKSDKVKVKMRVKEEMRST